ncbi:MAG: hypothetical protein AAB944_00235 [Patescibacteria group bacterium]
MVSTPTKKLKMFREPGVLACDARWYFAKERKNGNKISLREAIRVMLNQCNHSTNEQTVYEIAIGISVCHKKMAKKQKQMHSADLEPANRVITTPRPQVRKTARLPYSDD